MIIGLSGYAKSGKDTVAATLIEKCLGFQVKKFSYKLKLVASILTGYDVEDFEKQDVKDSNLPTMWNKVNVTWAIVGGEWAPVLTREEPYPVRLFLQELGTDAVRDNVHPDAWVNALMCDYDTLARMGAEPNWVITDVRFPNEAQAIKDSGGYVFRVVRPGISPVNAHSSETALDNWAFDGHIDNSGTLEDLSEEVGKLIIPTINKQ
jgi:hypothetical protein